jgi:hypothetical protein
LGRSATSGVGYWKSNSDTYRAKVLEGPYRVEGKRWQDGPIMHKYIWVGEYVLVRERWTATWRLGGQSETLRELPTTGRIEVPSHPGPGGGPIDGLL